MDGKARVGSIDAIEVFRGTLIRYTAGVRRALDDVMGEAKRTRGWLETDQRLKWEGEYRRRARRLEQAEQELFSARLSAMQDDRSAEMMEVRRAKRAVEEAEEKLRMIKRWRLAYDAQVGGLVRQLETLHEMMSLRMPQGVVWLTNSITSLQEYVQTAPPPTSLLDEPGESCEGGGA